MVIVKLDNGVGTITLRPNRSASWASNKCFMWAAGILTLLVATGWAAAGVWMILPFAGVEIALLCYLIHNVSRRTYRHQLICIDQNQISVSSGPEPTQGEFRCSLDDLVLVSSEPQHPMENRAIELRHGRRSLELGDFLNDQDKKYLVAILKALRIRVAVSDTASQTTLKA